MFRWWVFGVSGCLAFFCTYLACVVRLYTLGRARIAKQDLSDVENADVIFVLAYFLNDSGGLSRAYLSRCQVALGLWQRRARPILLMAGQTHGAPTSQAEAAAEWFVGQGVARSWLIFPQRQHWRAEAQDTLVECRLATDVMRKNRWRSLVCVTDGWQATQVGYALARTGAQICVKLTSDRPPGTMYLLKRLLALPATVFDPSGRLFFWLRWSRRAWLGRRV